MGQQRYVDPQCARGQWKFHKRLHCARRFGERQVLVSRKLPVSLRHSSWHGRHSERAVTAIDLCSRCVNGRGGRCRRVSRGARRSEDQLFNSSEKRVARALLLLARYGKQDMPYRVVPKISQETLAEIVGTTRSRVDFFLNKFKKLGFIESSCTTDGRPCRRTIAGRSDRQGCSLRISIRVVRAGSVGERAGRTLRRRRFVAEI